MHVFDDQRNYSLKIKLETYDLEHLRCTKFHLSNSRAQRTNRVLREPLMVDLILGVSQTTSAVRNLGVLDEYEFALMVLVLRQPVLGEDWERLGRID